MKLLRITPPKRSSTKALLLSPKIAITVGFYFFMGLQAQRGKAWAFYAGLAVYAVDALIYARLEDWMPVGFHVLAGFFIVKGLMRLRELAGTPTAA